MSIKSSSSPNCSLRLHTQRLEHFFNPTTECINVSIYTAAALSALMNILISTSVHVEAVTTSGLIDTDETLILGI